MNSCNNSQTIDVLAEMLLHFPPIVTNISVRNFRVCFMVFFSVSKKIFVLPSGLILTIYTVSVH